MTPRPSLFVIGVDPGDTTGLAALLVTTSAIQKIHSSEVGAGYVRSEVEWLLARAPLDCERLIGVERYLASGKPGLAQTPTAQQLVGVVLDVGERFATEVIVQSPSDVKKMTSNTLLKALGWFHSGGQGHANDALRHCARIVALRRASVYAQVITPLKLTRRRQHDAAVGLGEPDMIARQET